MAQGRPDWQLSVETELVRCNFKASLRGDHPPTPLVPPIYNSSTYELENVKEGEELSNTASKDGYIYSRWGNPTVDAAAEVVSRLEGAKGSLLFSSGCAAISTCMITFANSGDHMVVCQPVYGGVNSIIDKILVKLGLEVTYIKGNSIDEYKKAIKPNTKILYGETPANPTMSILDLEAFGALGKAHPQLLTMVDATFASPYLLQPLKYGVDLVIHSCTKYLGGHTDLVGGVVSYANKEHGKTLTDNQIYLGNNMSPWDAYILHRSMKTLAVRMDRHSENALKVAQFLQDHPKVSRVYYPGLPSHPDHEVAKRQMRNFSGMLSFELKGNLENGVTLVENMKLINLAVSLGGVESLVCHPASTTHCESYVPAEMRKAAGVTDTMIRLSVGIENADDIIKDLEQALDKV